MNDSRMNHSYTKQMRGFSLVELMIALLLGTLLVAAAVQLLTVNQRTFALQEAMSGLMEDGQMVLRFVGNDLRKAGYSGDSVASPTQPAIVFDGATPTTWHATRERLTVSHFGVEDCQGSISATPVQITNSYWVENNADGVPGLKCGGSLGAGDVELVSGVLAFNVEYGVDVTRDEQVGPFAFMQAGDAEATGRPIVAIRLTLLMERRSNVLPAAQATTWRLPWGNLVSGGDASAIQRLFHTTVMLRNMNWEEI